MLLSDLKHCALLEIDVQNDFCPAYIDKAGKQTQCGALAVKDGDKVIQPLNRLAIALEKAGGRIIASQDWHPPAHVSFASSHAGKKQGDSIMLENGIEQILWSDHCIQKSHGALFHENLIISPFIKIITKGCNKTLDSYSAFFENDKKTSTGLDIWLKTFGINHVIVGGLATDYCVFYSVMDALKLGLKVTVVSDAIMGVNIPIGSVDNAINTMKKSGAVFASSDDIIDSIDKQVL